MSTFSTESRNEYYNIELVDAANKLVTQVRPVEPGQQVLITFDTASDERVARATAGAVYSKGGIPTVIFYPTLSEPMADPPAPVSKAVLGADVWFDFSVAYQLYSPAYYKAIENGCIYVCLTGLDVDMMVRTIGLSTWNGVQRSALNGS